MSDYDYNNIPVGETPPYPLEICVCKMAAELSIKDITRNILSNATNDNKIKNIALILLTLYNTNHHEQRTLPQLTMDSQMVSTIQDKFNPSVSWINTQEYPPYSSYRQMMVKIEKIRDHIKNEKLSNDEKITLITIELI